MTDCRAGGVRNREKERMAREVFAESAALRVFIPADGKPAE